MSENYDAIVIGGGLAGVTAARELGHRGARTVLLEARSRLGGRAWTAEFGGAPIEMGGQNVYWTEPFIWSEISRYRLPIAEVVPFDTYAVAESGGLRTYPAAEAGRQLGVGFDAFFGEYGAVMPRPMDPTFLADALAEVDGWSIADRLGQLDLPEDALRWLQPWLAMRTGGSLKTGAFAWLLHIYALADWNWSKILTISSRYRIASGMKSLVDAIVADSGASVRLDSPVARVIDSGDRVEVTTTDGRSFSAGSAVVATSANLWSHIDFGGTLPAVKLDSAQDGMQTPYTFTKLWALVRGPVDNVYVQRPPSSSHPIIHLRKDMERPDGLTQVIAFSVDPDLDPNDEKAVAAAFLDVLPSRSAEIVDVVGHNWVTDPWTRGGTSLLRPGQMSNIEAIRRPEGRLSFATADIATSAPGFDGAIQTGIQAAAHAVDVIRSR